jgi:hypothetical protein
MARLTEMRIAPAKPLGDRAAEFALVFNKFHSVSFTIFYVRTKMIN